MYAGRAGGGMGLEERLKGRPGEVVVRILSIWLAILAGSAGISAQGRSADEAAVRDLVARYTAAREAKDAAALEALFTPDADQQTTSGEWRRGRPAILQGTAEASARNPGMRRIEVEAVRFLTSDVAIADGRYDITPAGGGPVQRMWTTIVAVRTAGTWRISAIRNMAPTGTVR